MKNPVSNHKVKKRIWKVYVNHVTNKMDAPLFPWNFWIRLLYKGTKNPASFTIVVNQVK
jgi:hypothetical protein